MGENDSEHMLEVQSATPANDDLARALDWIGISAAVGMVVAALVMSINP
jgi:ElaB/YqjD/DUF883 family membrane-anchored ribosome-binding protein